MGYKVKLDLFEGPFDLLVYLIENAEMSIYDIQVSEITRQYLGYVERMKELNIAVATEFMVLAAALIEIKSKMLLPRMKPDGETFAEEDPRSELVQRILEYKRFKHASEILEQRMEQNARIFEKPKEDISAYTDAPDEYLNLDLKQFVTAFHLFLRKKQKMEEIQRNYARVERQKITIESRIGYIKSLFSLKKKNHLQFSDLIQNESRYEKVLTFVSILEMAKQKWIRLCQPKLFGEITVEMEKAKDDQQKNNEISI